MEPLVKPGENIAIPISNDACYFAEVLYEEPVMYQVLAVNLNAYSNGSPGIYTVTSQNPPTVGNLNIFDLEHDGKSGILDVGQWRLVPADFYYLQVSFPGASAYKYLVKNYDTYITPYSSPRWTEFFTWGYDNRPTFTFMNYLPFPLFAKLYVYGVKYKTRLLSSAPPKYTLLPTIASQLFSGTCKPAKVGGGA